MSQVKLTLVDGQIIETVVPCSPVVETEEQKQKRIMEVTRQEYISFLDHTDHKESPFYEPSPDENISEIIELRRTRRRWLRENKNV